MDIQNLPKSEELATVVYSRIMELASFARSVLHLPFPDLEKINPSFSMIVKYCELMHVVIKENVEAGNSSTLGKIENITTIMSDIATGIIERNDRALVDAMCEIEDFLTRNKS